MAALQDFFAFCVIDIVAVSSEFEARRRHRKCIRQFELLEIGHIPRAVVEYIKFRRRYLQEHAFVNDVLIDQVSIEIGKVPKEPERHIGIPGRLMLEQDDEPISYKETDVIFDVIHENAGQGIDRNLLR